MFLNSFFKYHALEVSLRTLDLIHLIARLVMWISAGKVSQGPLCVKLCISEVT